MFVRFFLRTLFSAGLAAAVCSVFAQTPAAPNVTTPAVPVAQSAQAAAAPDSAPVALMPGEIYKQAMHPLDVVRSEMANWSDAELQALGVGVKMAHEACENAKPENYRGDDLYDLARLCAFGQDWGQANTVAQDYIAALDNNHRSQAYAISVSAQVHTNDIDGAVATARTMLRSLPYDAEVAYSMRSLKDYLEQSGNPAAVTLAQQEHPELMDALKQGVPLTAGHSEAVIGIGALFDSGMELAFFERYAGDDKAAGATVLELEDALGTTAAFTGSDWLEISRVRAEYSLIGWRLPQIEIERSFETKAAKVPTPANATRARQGAALRQTSSPAPNVNGPDFGSATVLVLFPEWCAQCRAMMKTVTEFATLNAETPIHAWGLMYEDATQSGSDMGVDLGAKELEGTNTLLVSADSAAKFPANDFPTAVVVDHSGVVRFIGPIPTDSFNGNGYIGRIIVRMATVEAEGKTSESGN